MNTQHTSTTTDTNLDPASTHKHLGKRAARCPGQILACGWFGSPILLPAGVGCRSGARPHVVTGPGSSTVQPPLGAPQSRSSTGSSRSTNPPRDRASAGLPTRSSALAALVAELDTTQVGRTTGASCPGRPTRSCTERVGPPARIATTPQPVTAPRSDDLWQQRPAASH